MYFSDSNTSQNWDLLTSLEAKIDTPINEFLDNFSYFSFTSILKLHPTYFAMYLAFSIFIIIFIYNREGRAKVFYVTLSILLLTFFLVLSSSRIVLLSFVVLILALLIIKFLRKGRLKIGAAIVGGFLLIIFTFIYFSPVTKYRLLHQITTTNLEFPKDHNKWNSTNLRLAEWFCSWETVKNNLINGVGIGDSQDYLFECYKKLNLGPYLLRYNSHNQYLETSVALGITGCFSLICCLLLSFKAVAKKNNILNVFFLLLFCMTSVTESTLEIQKGVVFFNFFVFLFLQKKN